MKLTLTSVKHPKPIEGDFKVQWEPLGQIEPKDLPEASDVYPGPWTEWGRGNGHIDLYDSLGRNFAHVYCWDEAEYNQLKEAIENSKL